MPTGWLRGVVKAVPSGDQVVIAAPAAPGVRQSIRVARNVDEQRREDNRKRPDSRDDRTKTDGARARSRR